MSHRSTLVWRHLSVGTYPPHILSKRQSCGWRELQPGARVNNFASIRHASTIVRMWRQSFVRKWFRRLRGAYRSFMHNLRANSLHFPRVERQQELSHAQRRESSGFLFRGQAIRVAELDCREIHADRLVMWADASVRNNRVGIGVVWDVHPKGYKELNYFKNDCYTSDYGESLALLAALRIARSMLQRNRQILQGSTTLKQVVIYTDSRNMVLAVAAHSKQRDFPKYTHAGALPIVLEELSEHVRVLQDLGAAVDLRWVPGHAGVRGNVLADKVAKSALPRKHKPAAPGFPVYGDHTNEVACESVVNAEWSKMTTVSKKARMFRALVARMKKEGTLSVIPTEVGLTIRRHRARPLARSPMEDMSKYHPTARKTAEGEYIIQG